MEKEKKTESHVLGKIVGGTVVGAPIGTWAASTAAKSYVHENAKEQGWFKAIDKKRADTIRNATDVQIDELLESRRYYDPDSGYINPRWFEKATQEYDKAAADILETKGLKSWNDYLKSLKGGQLAKTLAFGSVIAVAVGSLGYLMSGKLLDKSKDSQPAK